MIFQKYLKRERKIMGTYREQLLKETYGSAGAHIYGKPEEESPSGFLAVFKLKFTICLILFAGFAYLSVTGKSVFHITAEQIRAAVVDEKISSQIAEWQEEL